MILNATAKVGLLMAVSIGTSLLVVGLMWFGLSPILFIDIVTNIACILLMHKTNEIYYNKICSPCHHKINKCCNTYIDKQRNKNTQTPSNNNIEI